MKKAPLSGALGHALWRREDMRMGEMAEGMGFEPTIGLDIL